MNNQAPFIIYDAAAGSGKTFTLVKEYLKIILNKKNESYYKYILAITFTNKAVKEMKERIVKNLVSFSKKSIIDHPTEMVQLISRETGLSTSAIQQRANKILNHLLHNYSSFSVETIDSFNHRLIRTFARDLKLSGNFEINLDSDKLLSEAIDLLLLKAGTDRDITEVLINYSIEKMNDDKSWDVTYDITKTAKLLFNENDVKHLKNIEKNTLKDFLVFKKEILNKKQLLTKSIKEKATLVLQKIADNDIVPEDFLRKTLPNHFNKILEGNYNVYNNKLLENLQQGGNALYKAKTPEETASKIDGITPFLLDNYITIKDLVFKCQLIIELHKGITPLSIVNLVNQEIEVLKEEQNILPISEFNSLINSEIKNQPTPFIYERLGERYRHFFIDEFQDTSLLQWNNLIPLIDNSISQQFHDGNQGSLMLVGDVKQSIYRWRGGLPEQFINLTTHDNPFTVEKNVISLPENYRSRKEIVAFNNDFFSYVSTKLSNSLHQEIYFKGNQQKSILGNGGYIKFEFLDFENKEQGNEIYSEKVLNTIHELKQEGFFESDICILTRKKADGIILGRYLQENGITIVSSETLLLQHAPIVLFLVNCLNLCVYSENEKTKISFLDYLYDHLGIKEERHTYFKSLGKNDDFLNYLKNEFDFSFDEMQLKPLYESLEYCIKKIKLESKANAYLLGFLDMAFDFSLKINASKLSFIEEWELKKDKISIPISEGVNGVKLITIHKAKGLEFPVVIFPYADINIYEQREPHCWFPLKEDEYSFNESLIPTGFNKIKEFGEIGENLYNYQKETLELDNINLLYVTLTRAEVQLYVFAKQANEVKDDELKTINQYFEEFFKSISIWEEEKTIYEFGTKIKNIPLNKKTNEKSITPTFNSAFLEEHNLNIASKEAVLWGTDAERAIDSGTLVHGFMEKIIYQKDLEQVLEEIKLNPTISKKDKTYLKLILSEIVNHNYLNQFFNTTDVIEVERKIITQQGEVLIPDRLNIKNSKIITILDYKTGSYHLKHEIQLEKYSKALINMGYEVSEKILIYCSLEGIELKKV